MPTKRLTGRHRDKQRTAGQRQGIRFKDVVIFSLIPLLVGAYLLAAALLDYHQHSQFKDWWSRHPDLNSFLLKRIWTATRFFKIITLQQQLDAEAADAGIIRLRVDPSQLHLWQRDGLALWDQWIDAALVHGSTFHPVKLRKRGDTSIHWLTEKKSFTLKTSKSSLFKGYRRLAFTVKEVLPQYLTNRLAAQFGLLTPFSTITPVFLNDRFYGIYRAAELIDESFLRRQGRMPGNIFRGDTAERGEYFKGLPRNLFVNPYIWDRTAVVNSPSNDKLTIPQDFLLALHGTTFVDHLHLMNWLDQDEIARLFALMLIVGDPYHMSGVHNQFWYEDPSSGVLHPVPWDLRLLRLKASTREPLHRINDFLRVVLRNPLVSDHTFHLLSQYLADDKLLQQAERIVHDIYHRYQSHFEHDHLKRYLIPDVGAPSEVMAIFKDNLHLLKDWIRDSAIVYRAEIQTAHPIVLDFEARGYVGNDLHALEVAGDLKSTGATQLIADWNRNGILDASDPELPSQWSSTGAGGRMALVSPLALLPGIDTQQRAEIKPAPLHYRLFIKGIDKTSRITAVHADLRNRATQEPARIAAWQPGRTISPTPSWHPWQYPAPTPTIYRLSGDAHLSSTMRIPKGSTLIIEAGAKVHMAPDVSILAWGRVFARGSQTQPITFLPAVKGQPWGAIALQGPGANGSLFEHAQFTGGGGATLGRITYKGMVSIHRATGVTFHHSTFSNNTRSDDALNAVHAKVDLYDCTFIQANADAVDFDYSFGVIQNCQFDLSGNDAIDLMTSAPKIVGNLIRRSGDKGISIGEASHPFIFNNYITECVRGVEIKDRSEPWLVHNLITKNRVGIVQAVKNWRYGSGGWGKLVNSALEDNEVDLRSDRASRLTQIGSILGAPTHKGLAALDAQNIDWILAHYGIRSSAQTAGLLDSWQEADATTPKLSVTFQDDFDALTDGWSSNNSVLRLKKDAQNLVTSLRGSSGYIAQPVDWDLSDPQFTYVVVFELTGRQVQSTELTLFSSAGASKHAFDMPAATSSYTFASMKLQPAHYKAIQIAATSTANTSRIALHSYRLYALPQDTSPSPIEHSFRFQKEALGLREGS